VGLPYTVDRDGKNHNKLYCHAFKAPHTHQNINDRKHPWCDTLHTSHTPPSALPPEHIPWQLCYSPTTPHGSATPNARSRSDATLEKNKASILRTAKTRLRCTEQFPWPCEAFRRFFVVLDEASGYRSHGCWGWWVLWLGS
jgi:hypothetical protein